MPKDATTPRKPATRRYSPEQLVEEIVRRTVASLRELDFTEARSLLEQLHARAGSSFGQSQGSSWDAREGDTWVDRL